GARAAGAAAGGPGRWVAGGGPPAGAGRRDGAASFCPGGPPRALPLGHARLRRRSQAASAGGVATAARMHSAVTTASGTWLDSLAATLITCPVTCPPVALVPVVFVMAVPADEVAGGPAFLPLPDEPPAPGTVALPFFTTQFSGSPTFMHGDGCGASRRRVRTPLVNVGLAQPASVLRFGPEM